MTFSSLPDYSNRIENDLRQNILPFWIEKVTNHQDRTFFGSLTNDLVTDVSAERGALLTTRILWTYAAAYRRYRDPAYLAMADHAYHDLITRFHDREHGGFWWSVAADGTVQRDRKQIYGQAFAIYALAEYHAATARREPLAVAIATFQLIEKHSRDRTHGGYFEAFTRTWDPIADMRLSLVDLNEPKSQNTHLHILEAYTNLLRMWSNAELRQALAKLINIMLTQIANPHTGHLGLFFADDWTPRSDRISYGHDIEASWLFTKAANVVKDIPLALRTDAFAVTLANATLIEGVDDDGGIYNEGSPAGPTNTDKEWWPQAEGLVGFLNAYQISRQKHFLEAALHTWDFIEQKIIDRNHGEWVRGVSRDGRVLENELKVSFWKCPYHNGRAGLEAVSRLRTIAALP